MAEVSRAVVVAVAVSLSSVHADEEALRRIGEIEFPANQRIGFTERQFSKLLRDPLVQRGVVWIDMAGHVVMRIQHPRLEERRIENDRLVLRRPARRNHTSEDEAINSARPRYRTLDRSRPMHLALWAAAQVIAGDTGALATHFDLVPGPSVPLGTEAVAAEWHVELIPRHGRARKTLPAMRLYGRDNRLEHVRIDRGEGRRYDISFVRKQNDGHNTPRNPH